MGHWIDDAIRRISTQTKSLSCLRTLLLLLPTKMLLDHEVSASRIENAVRFAVLRLFNPDVPAKNYEMIAAM